MNSAASAVQKAGVIATGIIDQSCGEIKTASKKATSPLYNPLARYP
jgi:hypothetical protein